MSTKEPRDIAKDLLRPYVSRGDSLDAITQGGMGWGHIEYEAQIGGCVWHEVNGERKRRDINRYTLVITRVDASDCFLSFSVEGLMKEILDEGKIRQRSLWEAR